MAKKKRNGITEDERVIIDEFTASMIRAANWVDAFDDEPTDEPGSINQIGFDAHVEMLQTLYAHIGHEKLEHMKQIIEMAMDGDFRCPK